MRGDSLLASGYAVWGRLGESNKDTLIASSKQADRECGSCGCELDPIYKRALVLLNK